MLYTNRRMQGFTLIEALVVVALIGIISGIAWHYYEKESLRNHRTEAISALTRIANGLEDYHSDTMTYVNYDITAPYSQSYAKITSGLTSYQISFSNVSAATYTVTATAIGSQAKDSDCLTLSLNQQGLKSFTGDANSSVARCWGTSN